MILNTSSSVVVFTFTVFLIVETGVFGADMQVSLVNDGPVTIILEKYVN